MAGHAGLLLGDDRRLVRLVREALPRSAERIAVARSRRGHVRAVLRLLLIVLLRAVLRGRAAKRIAERIAIVPLIAGRIRVAESAEERRTVVLRLALLLRAGPRVLGGVGTGPYTPYSGAGRYCSVGASCVALLITVRSPAAEA